MTTINKTVLKLTGEKLTGHLLDYETALNHAYLNIEEGILTVNLSAKFSEEKNCMKVETSITFVADKVKDKGMLLYDPNEKKKPKQLSLFEVDNAYRDILFRDFSELRRQLQTVFDALRRQYLIDFKGAGISFRTFDLAA